LLKVALNTKNSNSNSFEWASILHSWNPTCLLLWSDQIKNSVSMRYAFKSEVYKYCQIIQCSRNALKVLKNVSITFRCILFYSDISWCSCV
jgi:hypothetical protein